MGSPVVPEYVPLALLVAIEAAAIVTAILIPRPAMATTALRLCRRCAKLHRRTEAFGRIADAVAVGALAFLVALPFVVAGYESGFSFAQGVLGISAVVAVLAVAAEANYLLRAWAALLWPRLTWSAKPARILGGGARWLGLLLALYVFHPAGIGRLLDGVGPHLVVDLKSTWTIFAGAVLLVFAAIVSLASRWLLPLVLNSLPTTLAVHGEPHGTSA